MTIQTVFFDENNRMKYFQSWQAICSSKQLISSAFFDFTFFQMFFKGFLINTVQISFVFVYVTFPVKVLVHLTLFFVYKISRKQVG